MRKYLFGAGLGGIVGGSIGILVVPVGWFTVLMVVVVMVNAFIAQAIWDEFYRKPKI